MRLLATISLSFTSAIIPSRDFSLSRILYTKCHKVVELPHEYLEASDYIHSAIEWATTSEDHERICEVLTQTPPMSVEGLEDSLSSLISENDPFQSAVGMPHRSNDPFQSAVGMPRRSNDPFQFAVGMHSGSNFIHSPTQHRAKKQRNRSPYQIISSNGELLNDPFGSAVGSHPIV